MKKIILAVLLLMLILCCSCNDGDDSVVSDISSVLSTDTVSSETTSTSKPYIPPVTKESVTKDATHIMYAFCHPGVDEEGGKAVFNFIPMKEYKGHVSPEESMIRVTGDLEKYSYDKTYAPNNAYLLWLKYDEDTNRYIDLFYYTSPLSEPQSFGGEEFEQYKQKVEWMNKSLGGEIYQLIQDLNEANGTE